MSTISELFEPFNPKACDECGECFHQCPVMQLPLSVAQTEIRRLKEGKRSKYVLNRCTTCFACNFFCPQNANPCQLIISLYNQEYKEKGLPLRAKYFQPHQVPNFRRYVVDRLPGDERRLLEKWGDLSPTKEFCYPGCNVCTVPYLTQTSLLEDVDIRGGLSYCCGETYYRTGMLDTLQQVGKRMQNYLRTLKAKKMMILCPAGYNMFANILPHFGMDIDLEITPLLVWLRERIENGTIHLKRKLDLRVTIQESCYGKIFGKEYYELPRKILEQIGIEVIEMKWSKECSLCCGIGAGFPIHSGYHPRDILLATFRSLREAKKTRADALVVYCAGCLQMLSAGKIFYPSRMPVYHILEVIQMAIGEEPLRRQDSRARVLSQGTLIHQFPKLLSNKRFWMEEISPKL